MTYTDLKANGNLLYLPAIIFYCSCTTCIAKVTNKPKHTCICL